MRVYLPHTLGSAELISASEYFEILIDICGDDPQNLVAVVILVQAMRVAGTKWARN
jgi:hypothetical protein